MKKIPSGQLPPTFFKHLETNSPLGLAIAEAASHHLNSKTYSGMFLRPHAWYIAELIKRLRIKSILDYGCGKGRQYEWVSHDDATGVPKGMTIEQFWATPVYKFDPCYEPFAKPPAGDGRFDLVICTHVLGSIPTDHLPTFKWEVYRHADKAVYIAEKLGPVGKKVFSNTDAFPRGWSRGDWERALAPTGRSGLEVILCTRELTAEGPELVRSRVRA